MNTYKTHSAKPAEVKRSWYVVDATDQVLGRLATNIAKVLRGKHKPTFTPHTDVGDYVIVLNASKIKVTGNKTEDKLYYRHSGYPGGIKQINFADLLEKSPEQVIKLAVKGMLPRNPLGRATLRKLKVYANEQHPHEAQQPKALEG